MSSPPSPPLSTLPSSSSPQTYTLSHLDSLLTHYLTLLDTYTTSRTHLSTSLSAGFLHLAQAQRSSMLPPGQRYGQEMYDQRMKAGRRVKVDGARGGAGAEEEDIGRGVEVEVHTYPDRAEKPKSMSIPTTQITTRNPESPSQNPHCKTKSRSAPNLPASTTPDSSPPSEEPIDSATSPLPPPTRNPLTQFAALPPPPLRASQSSFTTALSSIPLLLNTSRAMGLLEEEIGRVRRAMGLEIETETEEEGAEVETKVEAETKAEVEQERNGKTATATATPTSTPTSPTSPQRRNLASRSKVSEPRSRVLKLGT